APIHHRRDGGGELPRPEGSQKLRFACWLIKQINSKNYEGLRWVDKDHTQFRIPWKHTSRKDINPNDYKIFKRHRWSRRGSGSSQLTILKDLAKWKTNFRCALRSTNMFLMVQDNSKTSEDPHKVYKIISPSPDAVTAANEPESTYSCQALLYSPSIPSSLAETIPHNMDVTIYYRGKSLHEVQVATSSCLFTYNNEDLTMVPGCAQVVYFPSPDELPDRKQVQFTRQLLLSAGLLLEQKHKKIYAKRLNKCKVFWLLSWPPSPDHPRTVYLIQPTECLPCPCAAKTVLVPFTELKDFKEHQRAASPDFTIYLCFGQCFSKSKPKESMLILVKLVPKFCEYFHDMVLREGASSLNSGNVSLQLSSCFNSLFDLIEQYSMQIN
uniref:Interferon regulatory factor 7 n=1 Tax=Chelonoidis abingdonii TaxID=106734 RepID=A0A8C0HFR5_CHEAB